jgi:hypothetical protein
MLWFKKARNVKELVDVRAYPNNPIYPQGKPDACVVGEKTFSTWKKHAWRGSPAGDQSFLAFRLGLSAVLRTPP